MCCTAYVRDCVQDGAQRSRCSGVLLVGTEASFFRCSPRLDFFVPEVGSTLPNYLRARIVLEVEVHR